MKSIKLLTLIGIALISLSACNTFEGLGEDIQTLGSGVKRTANENK